MSAIIPKPGIGSDISAAIHSELSLCYTCSSCVAECPVNRFTNRLQPLKYVRMAGLGMAEELLRSPEIWYCLSCNRCTNICPMTVKPAGLLSFLRKEAVRRGYVRKGTAPEIAETQKRLHKVRYHAAALVKEGQKAADIALDRLADAPAPVWTDQGQLAYPSVEAKRFRKAFSGFLGRQTTLASCLTCCECTNSCPVARERSFFDPMRIVRMAVFGLHELLKSPSIWLCLECQTCTSACGQLVRGHMVLRRAQELAIEGGFVNGTFQENWQEVQKRIFAEYIGNIDTILDAGCLAGSNLRAGEPTYETFHEKPIWGSADSRHGPA